MDSAQRDAAIKADILEDIAQNGLFIAYIESDGYNPAFGYTIGLFKQYGHPELIVLGLNEQSTGAVLYLAHEAIIAGTKYLAEIPYPGFLVDLPVQFVEVQPEYYPDYLGYAGWYNDQSWNFPVLQLVWPNRSGAFPWEQGLTGSFKFRQLLLDRNTDFKFLEERDLEVFTTQEVLAGQPILFVRHDEEGDWQFYPERTPDVGNTVLVRLDQLVKMDHTLNDIYFLNYGESAERSGLRENWAIT